jgi:hypothetical protein
MLLQGLARNQQYARGVLAESLLGIAAMLFVIPRYGIVGAATAVTALMVLNRGVYTSWLTARVVSLPFSSYVASVYLRPFAAAVPAFILLWWLRASLIPGTHWLGVVEAAIISGTAYYPIAWFLCVAPQDRQMALRMFTKLRPFKRPVAGAAK